MSDPAPTRRSALSVLTGGGIAIGALVGGGGLMRSCAPTKGPSNLFKVDLSDMADGDIRIYVFGDSRKFVIRNELTLSVLDAECPVDPPFGWIANSFDVDSPFQCPRCTSKFDRSGKITQYWSNRTPPTDAPNLRVADIQTDGLTLLIAADQSAPDPDWNAL